MMMAKKNEREKQEDRRIKIKSLLIEQEGIFTFSQKLLYNAFADCDKI